MLREESRYNSLVMTTWNTYDSCGMVGILLAAPGSGYDRFTKPLEDAVASATCLWPTFRKAWDGCIATRNDRIIGVVKYFGVHEWKGFLCL